MPVNLPFLLRSCLRTCLLLTPLLGYSQNPLPTPGQAVLVGRISGNAADSVAVSLRENPLDSHERLFSAPLNSKGEFRLTIPLTGGTLADLVYGDDVAPLYLDPGTDLEVRFKAQNMGGSLKFKANGAQSGGSPSEQQHRQQAANANSYLAAFETQFVENDAYQVLPDNIRRYEAPFLSFLELRRKQELAFLEEHAARQAFTPEFYNYARAEAVYSYANDKLTFQDLREQVVSSEERLKVAADYYNFLNKPGLLDDPKAVQNELYHEFLLNYVHFAATQAHHQRTDPDFYPTCYALAMQQVSGPIRTVVLGRILQESFRFGHVRQSAAMLADFRTHDVQNQYYPALLKDFNQYKDFAIGAPAPDFKLATAKGDTVRLRDFAGKLVYLSFWKSTSGLCLRDLAHVQELMRKFEGKNIVFVSICLDENQQAWQSLVSAKRLPGVQAHLSGGLHSALAQAYALQTVPTYFLLGEDGTFINTKPKRLGSRTAADEINESFGKAGIYSSTLDLAVTHK